MMRLGLWAVVRVAVLLAAAGLVACSGKGGSQSLAQARQAFEAKDYKSATVQLKSYLQQSPDSGEARYLFGAVLLDSGDAAGAEIELRRALELGHPPAQATPPLARALLAQRKAAPVLMEFRSADLGDRLANLDLDTSVALAHAATGEMEQARERLQKVLASNPEFEPAQLALARVQAGERDFDGALGTLEALLARAPGSVDGWRLKGEVLVRGKRDTAGAVEAYGRAIALAPKSADLHAALISLHYVRQDGPAAAKQFEAMKSALPDHPLTKYYEAKYAFQSGDAARAAELMQPVLRALPDNPGVAFLAGGIDLQRGALSQAEAHLAKAVSLQPEFPAARQLLAGLYLRTNQPAKALNVLRAVADRSDADAETLALAGRAALMSSDTKLSDRYFTRAAKSNPTTASARTALALSQLSKGQDLAALAELQAVAASDPGTAADMTLISARMQRGEFDAALKAIEMLDKKTPASPVAPELRARAQLERKDAAAARRSYEEALTRQADYMPAVAGLAALDFLEGKPDVAGKRFLDVIKKYPRNVQAYLSLADLEGRTGATKDAVAKRIGEAVAANPSDADARLALIEHHRRHGDVKSAVEAAQAAVAALPDNPLLQDQLGRVQLAAGDTNQALATFGKLAAQYGQAPYGPRGLAEVALVKQDFEGAARHAKRALEIDPRSLEAKRAALTAAMRLKRHDDALAIAKSIQSDWPAEALGHILEGEVEMARGRWDDASKAFGAALKASNPAQAPGRYHAALVSANKAAEAARFADTWSATHPKDTLFLLYLADTASRKGDAAGAERRYRQVLELQPENALALNNLASLLIGQSKPGALELAQRAVKAAPGQLALQDTLAMALAQNNQLVQAIDLQKKVVAAAPDAPAYRLTLARIYLLAGEKASARAELEKLSRSEKTYPGQSDVPDLLKQAGA